MAATVRSTAAFATAGAGVFLALFGAEGIPAAAFVAAVLGAGAGFFVVTDAAFFVTADAGFFTADAGFFVADTGLFVTADVGFFVTADAGFFATPDVAFFAPRASPGDGVELSRAPAFFLLLAIGAQYTTRRALPTRAGPAACPAAGARGS